MPRGTVQPAPATLLISGTGESDRNGNGGGLDMNIYKDLADELGKMGLVTLRYDKRGTHASGGDFYETGFWDLVEDSTACVRFLQSRPEVDPNRIVLLGHSEGAFIAPVTHASQPVQGLILIAGALENLVHDIMPRQSAQALQEMETAKGIKGLRFRLFNVPGKTRKQSAAFMEKVISSATPTIKFKGIKLSAKWFQEHAALNLAEYMKEVSCPLLAITGSNDIQAPPEHAKMLAEAVKGEAEWHIVPQMNHVLRKYDKAHTMLGLVKEYKKSIADPIEPEFIKLLDQWMRKYKFM
ncbi:lysophospholipase [Paenibacillus melissococcoides]|uniref:Lysophospholipase n=1 Tax=Paenibacillus melissococcoides TaxID=2912268 RepID=A0ABM9FXT5_9BACL|nr:lysophospholipase [Paenibacillus melissococcoides]MEB9895753.1 lysophospholipase [Bacillus cereus]CAH8244030.1 lysophospholipase [Paenibacillus melissococcoides]CAH8703996.1 lysophospholipase [Paenibacillus melissococcoides]